MNLVAITSIIFGSLIILALAYLVSRRVPRKLKKDYFQDKWRDLQKLCAHKETWPMAIINADTLLDEALKRRKFRGKSMGERLVNAQRLLSDNDAVWFGHKLRNQLVHETKVRLKEKDVKEALLGFRQALRDLGALPGEQ